MTFLSIKVSFPQDVALDGLDDVIFDLACTLGALEKYVRMCPSSRASGIIGLGLGLGIAVLELFF